MSFACTKTSLVLLNVFYIIVAIILISIAGHNLTQNDTNYSLPIIGGILACGIFLLIIALVGIWGSLRHHQICLFFYMVVVFILFVIQFSIACACLAVSKDTQLLFAEEGWKDVSNKTKMYIQEEYKCCGFNNVTIKETEPLGHPSCYNIGTCYVNKENATMCEKDGDCCSFINDYCGCELCSLVLEDSISHAFSVTGGVSLFFSFTEIIGAFLARSYRNMYGSQMTGTY